MCFISHSEVQHHSSHGYRNNLSLHWENGSKEEGDISFPLSDVLGLQKVKAINLDSRNDPSSTRDHECKQS